MGYLDRKSRVVDFALTERGRALYSVGKLNFSYYSFFDDGFDYDPYMTAPNPEYDDVQIAAESLPMFEVPFIKNVNDMVSPLQPVSNVFTAAPDYHLLPYISSPENNMHVTSSCIQDINGDTYDRSSTSEAQIDLVISGEKEAGNKGFIVKVFLSSSNGLSELEIKQDTLGRKVYDSFLAVKVDNEQVIDRDQIRKRQLVKK